MTRRAILEWTGRAALGIAGGAALAFWAVELGWPIGGDGLQRTTVRVMMAAAAVWVGCRLVRALG